jgi:hypothetical protein
MLYRENYLKTKKKKIQTECFFLSFIGCPWIEKDELNGYRSITRLSYI